MKYLLAILALCNCSLAFGQFQTKKVLFLGNSYTYVNDLPQMTAEVALSVGDTLLVDSSTPGGYTLQGHSTNPTSLSKIAAGNWDEVVLQEQSQIPSFPINQVETGSFPYAHLLDSLIHAASPCAETVFYMTWGRKNGDASNCPTWPPVCTYEGMDSLLNLRYRIMAENNQAVLSPVGAVWHYIRTLFPEIELYQSDESHPSVAGTYAAACCFYTTLFRKDPLEILFDGTLAAADAANIREAVKAVVFDHLPEWHIGEYDPSAQFVYIALGATTISFTNQSAYAGNYSWDFGDGATSPEANPEHTYATTGTYAVKLIAERCGIQDTALQTILVGISSAALPSDKGWKIFPNPAKSILTLDRRPSGHISYRIADIQGNTVQNGVVPDAVKQIDISLLPPGVYFFQLFSNNQSHGQQKFLKP